MLTRAQLKQWAKQQVIGSRGTFYLAAVLSFVLMIVANIPTIIIEIVFDNKELGNIYQNIAAFLIQPSFKMGYAIISLLVISNISISISNFIEGFKFFGKAILISILTFIFTGVWVIYIITLGLGFFVGGNLVTGMLGNSITNVIMLMIFVIALFAVLIIATIRSYSYRQAYYVLADNQQLSSLNCITASKNMMKGNKASLFVLDLTFYWWVFVGLFIGFGFIVYSFYSRGMMGLPNFGIMAIAFIIFAIIGIAYFIVMPYYNVTYAAFYANIKNKIIAESNMYTQQMNSQYPPQYGQQYQQYQNPQQAPFNQQNPPQYGQPMQPQQYSQPTGQQYDVPANEQFASQEPNIEPAMPVDASVADTQVDTTSESISNNENNSTEL